jgi:ubiquinone/menaquinone biosynthesis C-methylase UbiE
MNNRTIPWIDPLTRKPLIKNKNFLISGKSKYQIYNGIPNFVESINNKKQNQVSKSFGFKWTTTNFGQDDDEFETKLKKPILDFMGITEKDLYFFKNKTVLDIGVGSGSTARLWANSAKEFHGIDISRAIYRAKNAIKNYCENPILSQADLNHLPYADRSFDVIVSNGVLHHTPSTRNSLKNIIKKLKLGGHCLFYVYKKKTPIREFTDDYIREQISDLSHKKSLKLMESITNFGKDISKQNITVKISEDLPILGIKKGNYDLQRFIYSNFFKCFWNDDWGFDYSNMVNFDWYNPTFAWRHSKNEIKGWCKDFKLKIKFLKESESGYTCLTVKY